MRAAPKESVAWVASAMERRFGFSLAGSNAPILEAAVAEQCATLDDARALAAVIDRAPVAQGPLRHFLERVLVGETYFLRIPEQFEALQEHAPRLLLERGAVEAWSCGCATGEEPYSLALTLVARLGPAAKIDVVGTDVQPAFLEAAARALYQARAVRLVPNSLKGTWFESEGDKLKPKAELRSRVQLSAWNLLDGPFKGRTFDVVFCRNVLIYMSAAALKRTAETLRAAVRPGGLLFLGAADLMGPLAGFRLVEQCGAIFFERTAEPPVADRRGGRVPASPPPRSSPLPLRNESPTEVLARARMLAQHGHVADARASLEALGGGEAPLEALMLLARLCADDGDARAAVGWCERALLLDGTHVEANHLLAVLYEEEGRWEDAERHFTRATCADADFAVGHVGLGALYRKMGQGALARRHLELAAGLLAGHSASEVPPGGHGTSVGWLNLAIETLRKDLA